MNLPDGDIPGVTQRLYKSIPVPSLLLEPAPRLATASPLVSCVEGIKSGKGLRALRAPGCFGLLRGGHNSRWISTVRQNTYELMRTFHRWECISPTAVLKKSGWSRAPTRPQIPTLSISLALSLFLFLWAGWGVRVSIILCLVRPPCRVARLLRDGLLMPR